MSRACAAVITLGLGLGLGCGSAQKPAPSGPPAAPAPAPDAGVPAAVPLDRDYPRLAERAVSLYDAVAEAFRAAGEDCARATSRLGELAAAYRDVVAANAKVLHEGRARELKQALARHGDQFDAAAKSIVESKAMARCSEDPAFTRAFDDLVGAP